MIRHNLSTWMTQIEVGFNVIKHSTRHKLVFFFSSENFGNDFILTYICVMVICQIGNQV
jgi:hypothetical protein